MENHSHTKSALDWIGDITTVLIMLPVLIIAAVFIAAWYICKYPFWLIGMKIRDARRVK